MTGINTLISYSQKVRQKLLVTLWNLNHPRQISLGFALACFGLPGVITATRKQTNKQTIRFSYKGYVEKYVLLA